MQNTNVETQIEEVLSSLGIGDDKGASYLKEAIISAIKC